MIWVEPEWRPAFNSVVSRLDRAELTILVGVLSRQWNRGVAWGRDNPTDRSVN